MVTFSAGQIEMVAEDDANKRYTVREKQSRKLTTIYWSEKKKLPRRSRVTSSAIPADAGAPAEVVPAPEPK
jgi:hypothetical protein